MDADVRGKGSSDKIQRMLDERESRLHTLHSVPTFCMPIIKL